MAIPISIIYSITDDKGKDSSTEIKVPSTMTNFEVALFAQQVAELIDAMIGGYITKVGFSYSFVPTGVKTGAVTNSDVEEGARFQFRALGGFFTRLRIPTFLETLFSPNSRDVDTGDPDVAAFVAAIEDGIDLNGVGLGGLVNPVSSHEEDVILLDFAKESFLSSGTS